MCVCVCIGSVSYKEQLPNTTFRMFANCPVSWHSSPTLPFSPFHSQEVNKIMQHKVDLALPPPISWVPPLAADWKMQLPLFMCPLWQLGVRIIAVYHIDTFRKRAIKNRPSLWFIMARIEVQSQLV